MISHDEARRVFAFVDRVGQRRAIAMLGIGKSTLLAALEQGRLLQATRDRLFESLEREERAA